MLTACRRGVAVGAFACILTAGIFTVPSALGQFSGSHVPDKISRGESANLFASWGGNAAIDGFVVELPSGWQLESAALLKNAFRLVPVTVRSAGDGRYEVTLESRLDAAGEIVIRVRGGEAYGSDHVTVTPFVISAASGRRQALHADHLSLIVNPNGGYVDPENRVASFAEVDARPLVFRPERMPSLDLSRGFSASFWMKSTELNQVVFSTWNGDENRVYPIEVVVGPAGRLRCFRGRPGEHQSMGSKKPIADGMWHRIVVTNEPDAGWMRLQIDGRTVDSLFSATPLEIAMELPLAVGGRVPGSDEYFDGMKPFSGFLDEVHVQQFPSKGVKRRTAPLEIDFSRPVPGGLLVAPVRGVRLIKSDLSFGRPVDDFRASHQGGAVLLRWQAHDAESVEFVVERSRDGHRFEEVHQVRASSQSRTYEFSDSDAGEGVAFYRLRQSFAGGAERVSSTIKVGMGEEQPDRVTLVGNFPNPFNNTTTITYKVNEQTHVEMSVWDVSGQPVRHLVDRTVAPGIYEVQFNADELPSGTYFVRMHGEGGTKSHKMILMK